MTVLVSFLRICTPSRNKGGVFTGLNRPFHVCTMSALCLQSADILMILGGIEMHKQGATMRRITLYSCIFLEKEMVGVTGIEPVTPTMST